MKTDDYKDLYIQEAEEILNQFEKGILCCDQYGHSTERVEELFRCAHNLKGISGAMGYDSVVEASHSIESTLDKFRKGEIEITGDKASLMLKVSDYLRELVNSATGEEKGNGGNLPGRIADLMEEAGCSSRSKGYRQDSMEKGSPPDDSPGRIRENIDETVRPRITSIKVELGKLDKIMDLVGELIISGIRLRESAREANSKDLMDELESTDRLISEIQKDVMEVRLVPVGHVFRRFMRVTRDAAVETGKKVRLVTAGEDIGLGRTVLEGMVDPLVHIIRNAVDHGVEPPGQREELGKPAEGTIRLSARRERNFVIIEVSDDGRGIDYRKVANKLKADNPERLAGENPREDQLTEMLAAPGFSTSDRVNKISGRGMGMNIVKKAVDSFGGTFDITSRMGEGTTITLKLPVNLSIIKSLLFQLGKDVHAIPLESVVETARVEIGSMAKIGGRDVIRMGEETIPVLRPWEIMDLDYSRNKDRFEKLVIVEAEGKSTGIIVDKILGQQDVVVKGLPSMMKGDTGILGATVMGSGEIAFIWDSRVFSKGKVSYESHQKAVVS